MKEDKIIVVILLIVITFLLTKIVLTNKYDVNHDGKVNSKDMLDLRLYLINKGDDN